MKQLTVLISVVILVAVFAFAQESPSPQTSFFASESPASVSPVEFVSEESPAAFKWEARMHDFGEIQKGTPATHTFTFVNVGEQPLEIKQVKPSCGCTVVDYSKEPIPLGGTGFVKATYNAAKPGLFTKTLSVMSNADEPTLVLRIKGEVAE